MGWSFYLLIFFVVVVVNLLTKSRVDGVGAFKKVGSLLTGDRVQGERADEVGLFLMEIKTLEKKTNSRQEGTWSKMVWLGQMKLHLNISSWPSGYWTG